MDQNEIRPVFILGFPRSGTTVMTTTIISLEGFWGCNRRVEGMWIQHFGLLFNPESNLERSSVLQDPKKFEIFKDCFARFADDFWRKAYGHPDGRWVDKTPDFAQIDSVTMIKQLFPHARYIFMYRNPYKCMMSNCIAWSHLRQDISRLAKRWAEVMNQWRNVRRELPQESYCEIYQGKLQEQLGLLAPLLGLSLQKHNEMKEFVNKNRFPVKQYKREIYENFLFTEKEKNKINNMIKHEILHWPELVKGVSLPG